MSFAFIFESVGGTEWFVLLGVILIVVGPKNLPAAARKAGQIMTNLRRAADEFKRQLLSMDEEVRKTVNDAVSDDSSSNAPDGQDSNDSSTSDYNGEYDESGNPYPDGNPYPGHEDEFFDETSYQNDYGPGSSDAEPSAGETDSAPDSDEQDSPTPTPTDAELRAVKITVSPAPGKRK